MDDVFIHNQSEITANGSGCRNRGVCRSHQRAAFRNGALPRDDHFDHGAGSDVFDEALVKRFALMLGVIGFGLLEADHTKLHALHLQTRTLETVDDLADMAVANSVGLNHGVCFLDCHTFLVPFEKLYLKLSLVLAVYVQLDADDLPTDAVTIQDDAIGQ